MSKTHAVSCITEVYNSSEAQGFDLSKSYPVAWEIIYRNDAGGRKLTDTVYEVMQQMNEAEGIIMQLQGKETDIARSAELAFSTSAAFGKAVHAVLKNIHLHNDGDGQLITKYKLIEDGRAAGRNMSLSTHQNIPLS